MLDEKEGTMEDISMTNDDATESKFWATKLGYFDDPYVKLFLAHPEKVKKKGPIIHKGYHTRVTAIRNLISQFLRAGGKQIVSLGAGFDTNYFILKTQHKNIDIQYFEVDYSSIVKQKATFIDRSTELKSFFTTWTYENGNYTSSDYHLIGADIRELETLEKLLTQYGLSPDLPTLLLSECVLIYISSNFSSNILQWASGYFKSSMFIIYEMILPHDGFGKMMIQNLNERGVSLSSYQQYPDLESQKKRMLDLGFSFSEALDMNSIGSKLLEKEDVRRVSRLEPLDEFEELILIQAHYCIVIGTKDKSGNSIFKDVTLFVNK